MPETTYENNFVIKLKNKFGRQKFSCVFRELQSNINDTSVASTSAYWTVRLGFNHRRE